MAYSIDCACDRCGDAHRLSVDLAKLEGDCRVVDAIYAANDARCQMAP